MLAGATLGYSIGVQALPFYTAGLFIAELHDEYGWSRGALSLGPTFMIAGLGVASPIIGLLADKFGERRLIFPGLGILVLAFIALSRIDERILQYFLLMAGMAFFAAGSSAPLYARIISRQFDKARGTALGIGITGTAVSSALIPPLLQRVMDAHGWRTGYLMLAAVVVACAPAIYFLLRKGEEKVVRQQPRAYGNDDAFSFSSVLSDRTFWILALSLFTTSLACAGLVIHFVPMLTDHGMSAADAAVYAGVIGVVLLLSRLLVGLLLDRFFAPHVAAIIMGLCAAGFVIFALLGPRFAIVGAIATGLAFGSEGDLMAYLAGRYFKLKTFGRVFGLLYAVFLAGGALSPALYGAVADRYGNYDVIIFVCGGVLALAAVLFSMLPRYPVVRTDS